MAVINAKQQSLKMNHIVGINGSYRSEGASASALAAVLDNARAGSANTRTIRLAERQINFCTNCRECMQPPGKRRGSCIFRDEDDMEGILQTIDAADALVIAAPVNLADVNALTRCFMERCVGYAYWPWGTQGGPKMRLPKPTRPAVLISSSAAPGPINNRLFGSQAITSLQRLARLLGFRPTGILKPGLVLERNYQLDEKTRAKAARLGQKLTTAN